MTLAKNHFGTRGFALVCLVLLTTIAITSRAAEVPRFVEGTHKGGQLQFVGSLPVLTVRGTPEEIGEQQAVLTAKMIKPLLEVPRKILRRHGAEEAWPRAVLVSGKLMDNAPDEYRRELQAVIKTIGFGREELTVANTMLELRRIGGCSTLYIAPERSKTGKPMMGRNFDFHPLGILDRSGLVTLFHPKGKKSFASVGFPALGGVVSGMNEDGLCVATLDVHASADGSPVFDIRGVPMTYCYRRLLEECGTIAEAEKLLRSMRRTTWSNLAVCDKEGAAVFEITPKTVAVRKAVGGVLPCTNHFRSRTLARATECRRYARFLADTARGKLGRDDLVGRMHAVHQGSMTIQSMIFQPVELKLHIGMGKGPVTARPLEELELEKLLKK